MGSRTVYRVSRQLYVEIYLQQAHLAATLLNNIQVIHKPERKVICKRGVLQQAMNGYDPSVIGYAWDDANPRIQLEPRRSRGYI